MNLEDFRVAVDDWVDSNLGELRPEYDGPGSLEQQMAQFVKVQRAAFDASWARYGWPESVGGLGGSSLLRGYLGEALVARDLVVPGIYSMTELLLPTLIDFAAPNLAAAMAPRLLRGDETWCQGFSEPGTGSNLGSLSCRAERTTDGWRVNGQKLWTSLAQFATRCVLLTRTGPPESAHRGISALLVDMDTPGVLVRPFETMHGEPEFSEVYFDDVLVPFERTLGGEGDGWAVAMNLLPYERSTSLGNRAVYLHRQLQSLLEVAPMDMIDPTRLGEIVQQLFAFRARSRSTQHRLAAGDRLGPETSIDKLLLPAAEQALQDLVAQVLPESVILGDSTHDKGRRRAYLFSRAASIYGGTSEIQKNILARQVLDLGSDR